MFDLFNNVDRVQTLEPDTYDSDQNTDVLDRRDFEALVHMISFGESGDTLSGSVKIDLILEEGDESNGSDMAAVTDSDHVVGGTVDSNGIFATIDEAADDQQIYAIGYVGFKRYTRVKLDFTGTHTNGIPVGGAALRGRPYVRKV